MTYLDASVVFSLHFHDSNTLPALDLVRNATAPFLVSDLCEMETVNAFALRVFRNEMSERNMNIAANDLESDLRSGIFLFKQISTGAVARARTIARRVTPFSGVRAADLVHIAAALEFSATALYTFDVKQHRAAQNAGLAVNQLPTH